MNRLTVTGTVIRVGDDIDSDRMYPGRYLALTDWEEQSHHLFEGLGAEWPARLRGHAILVAGRNLGFGSSREPAATGLLGAGIRLVIAESCGRGFFRNCINNGLAVIQDPVMAHAIADGEAVSVDLAAGSAEAGGRRYAFPPLPAELNRIIAAGGLLSTLGAPA